MEVFDVGGDFHRAAERFNDAAEGVGGCAIREREFTVPVSHALGPDEDEVEGRHGEEVRELHPDGSWKGGFGARAQDEEPDWWWVGSKAGDAWACAGAWRV